MSNPSHILFISRIHLSNPPQDEGDEQEEQRLCPVQEDGQRQTETHRHRHQTATHPHRAAPCLVRGREKKDPISSAVQPFSDLCTLTSLETSSCSPLTARKTPATDRLDNKLIVADYDFTS